MFNQIDNTSAVKYRHNKDASSIIIEFALDKGLISTDSVEHDKNQDTVHLLLKMLS